MQNLVLDDIRVESFEVATRGGVVAHAASDDCYNRTRGCKNPDTRYDGDSCHGSCYGSDGAVC